MACATSYSTNDLQLLPFYIYYSMFGFQRIGDSAWQAGDMRARGFLLGATAGRTTLNGEGLQHEDGHSMVQAGLIPNCAATTRPSRYEVVVIIQHGMQRMLAEQQDEYWYVTLMNENYAHPDMPEGSAEGIIKGMYLFTRCAASRRRASCACSCWAAARSCAKSIAAAELLDKDFGVTADIWSCPSFNELARDGFDAERWNRLHPEDKTPRKAVRHAACSKAARARRSSPPTTSAPTPNRSARSCRCSYTVLGTDGFGRSDTRANLRRHFEVDRYYIAHAAIAALAAEGKMTAKDVARAIKLYKIDAEKPNPVSV